MGEGINKNDKRTTGAETGGKSTAGNSGTGGSSDSGRSRGRGRGKTESSELPKLVAIEVPGGDKKEEEKKPEQKKGRGRPKGSTKKTGAPKKAPAGDTKQVEILLTTVCAIIGSRPGLEMFVLTPAEAKQIAEPLSNILAKNEALAGAMSEHGDAVALVTACFMIFVPKFIQYKQQNPKKEKPKKEKPKMTEVKTNVSTPRNEAGKNSRDRKRDDKQATAYDETNRHKFGGELHRVAEPIAGWGY